MTDYPKASLTVDAVVFCDQGSFAKDQILLIKRRDEPFEGMWALPGGFVDLGDGSPENQGETMEEAVAREIREETGLGAEHAYRELSRRYNSGFNFLTMLSDPKRDPRGRTVSGVFVFPVKVEAMWQAKAGDDAAEIRWVSVADALKGEIELAFDHKLAVQKFVEWLEDARY